MLAKDSQEINLDELLGKNMSGYDENRDPKSA